MKKDFLPQSPRKGPPLPRILGIAWPRARIFKMVDLDGFWVDEKLDRTLHLTFEEENTLVFDLFDTSAAAYAAKGNVLSEVTIKLVTGETKC